MQTEHNQSKRYETEDLTANGYKKIVFMFVITSFVLVGSIIAAYRFFNVSSYLNYNTVRDSGIPMLSRLQGNATVQGDMVKLRQQEHEETTEYRWLDPNHKVLSIPVQRALEITLSEGLDKHISQGSE